LCVDIHPTEQRKILTGGNDSNVILFDREKGKILATLSGHSKKVTSVLFHPTKDVVFSSSADKTAAVWTADGKGYSASHTVKNHKDEVVGVTLHPTGDYFVTASLDGLWSFHDLNTSSCLTSVEVGAGVSAVNFHPDGLILGTGTTSNVIRIWDIKSQGNVANFEGHEGMVVDISFSENGYYLATAAQDNIVKLWDLRKLKNFQNIELPKDFKLSGVDWDSSGTYLAACGADIRVFMGKALDHILTLQKHTSPVTDVKWGQDALFLASTSMDRTLKFWGKKAKGKR
jgi:pre-mRNA-processing factor 19